MLYALIAFLKPGTGAIPQSVQVQVSDFIGQPITKIRSAGALHDASGHRSGMMMIFEEENREAAEVFANGSPYLKAGLFEEVRLYEYSDEIG
jgi:uncharacterized protein YciI